MKNSTKQFLSVVPIIFVLILTALLFNRIREFSPTTLPIFKYIPSILFVVAMIISYYFNRSQIFFISMILIMSQFVLDSSYGMISSIGIEAKAIENMVLSLVPLNILLFSLLKERGILSFYGKLRIVFIFVEVIFVIHTIALKNYESIKFFNTNLIGENGSNQGMLPQLAMLVIAVVFISCITKYLFKKSMVDIFYAAVVIEIFVAFILRSREYAVSIFYSGALLLLIILVIQSSYSMAYIDELTGLPGRRALKEHLSKLSRQYVIAMLDIDFFKKFNDTYGHDIGDEVLKLVAACLTQVGGGGKPFRYGGEEFAIIFQHNDMKEAMGYLEELRELVSKTSYTYHGKKKTKSDGKRTRGKQLNVTISIGVGEYSEHDRTPEDVMKAADKALYRAKKKGRNCVSK